MISMLRLLPLMLLFMLLPSKSAAVTIATSDIPTLEALIHDHRVGYTELLVRSGIEFTNERLHDVSAATGFEYKELNIELDKLSRSFDVIDAVMRGLSVSLNIGKTIKFVSKKMPEHIKQVNDFADWLKSNGPPKAQDLHIINYNLEMITKLKKEIPKIYKAIVQIFAIKTAEFECTISETHRIMNELDSSMNNIRAAIETAYNNCWTYIRIRTTFWKPTAFEKVDIRKIARAAYKRWSEYKSNKPPKPMP